MSTCIGVDVGGTFTDFVLIGPEGLRVEKRLSSPDDPSRSVMQGLRELDPQALLPVVHGTTVATNALLERRGARTAFVTTRGFADLLALGRAQRSQLYALEPQPRASLIGADEGLCFEIDERVGADGAVLRAPSDGELDAVVEALLGAEVESVAVCLLFSYLRPEHERRFAAALRRHAAAPAFVSLSVDVLPEMREYERASTTVVNAYVMPVMARYLERLAAAAAPRRLSVMASHAGSLRPEVAAALPVATILSGPAAGVLGALSVARRAGIPRCITFDMGGTSTDVALCDGDVPFTGRTEVGGFPVHRPAVDVHTVGAGGGSIVRVDAAGALRVGPQSAGADPGPAAYGRGGRLPTVTDAHVVLGRLPASRRLAGAVALDLEAARIAFEPVARALGCAIEAAALAALRVADAHMERALRRVSVEQGFDPSDFTLLAFGGAGGLHACALADSIGARQALLPAIPGALSALGLATAAPVATVSRTVLGLSGASPDLEAVFDALRLEAEAQLDASETSGLRYQRLADLRYLGQSWELSLPWPEDGDLERAFSRAHRQRYGFVRAEQPIELVTLRLRVSAEAPARLPAPSFRSSRAEGVIPERLEVCLPDGRRARIPVHERASLEPGRALPTPCLVLQPDTTIFIAPDWSASVNPRGDILLSSPMRGARIATLGAAIDEPARPASESENREP